MKRIFIALMPWMALATAVGQTRSAQVVFTYVGTLKAPCYRLADECFVPAAAAKELGWDVEFSDDRAQIHAFGQEAEVAARTFSGAPCLALRKAVAALGGTSEWQDGDRLRVLSIIRSATVDASSATVEAGLPVRAAFSFHESPNRIVIDFRGARYQSDATLALRTGAKIEQVRDDVARLTIEADAMPAVPESVETPTAKFRWTFASPQEVPAAQPAPAPAVPPTNKPDEGSVGGVLPSAPPTTQFGPLSFQVESDSTSSLVGTFRLPVLLDASPAVRRPDPTVVEILLPGLILTDAPPKSASSSIVEIAVRQDRPGAVIVIKLPRPFGVEVSGTRNEVRLRLFKPNIGNGRLAGRTVVVDAGHGGHDTGAKAPDGSLIEKLMTLEIAKLTAERLGEEGATVIMTRRTDEFIPLPDRSEVANRSGADFFLSIHINSNGQNTSSTGGITFIHEHDPTCQVLAECIQHEIALVSHLPSLGVWSDTKIYHSGFSVLRHAKVPAVLIEMGFLSNEYDRAVMATPQFKENAAKAIVAGLKVYLGDVKTAAR
ncbi:MAG: N-acetylmuramoyl-L-alanine amidase [Fimbriimonas ginsengisoli]|uniref:N-acetylmuramoyl-L-alanine amidase n=1 Tax=Fimbriimonas ginsengisoli TaxID=1005039 RepID=A0A931PW05_FIMGI|nr:N-acetylmuramoyl-L-alanine amidase [Fimbriimonas ginsengisoli]